MTETKLVPAVVEPPKPEKPKGKGGRPKGSISKRTLDLMSELEVRHFNVVDEKLRVYRAAMDGAEEFKDFYARLLEKLEGLSGLEGRVTINIRDPRADFLKVAESSISDLMQYVFPRRKAIELTGKDGEPVTLSFTDLIRKASVDDPESL